jgi:hypothetical protein
VWVQESQRALVPVAPMEKSNSSIPNGFRLRELTDRARRALPSRMGEALALVAQPGAGITSELMPTSPSCRTLLGADRPEGNPFITAAPVVT